MNAETAPNSSENTPAAVDDQTPATGSSIPRWLRNAGLGSWALIGISLVVIGIVYGTAQISPVFVAIFAALVFTALLNPTVDSLNKHMGRGIAVVITLLGSILVFAGLITFVVTSVAGQWSRLGNQLAHGMDKIVDFLDGLPFNISLTSDQVFEWMSTMMTRGEEYLYENWERLATRALSNVGGVGLFFMILFLTLFITIFFLLQGSQMWRWFLNMLPTDKRAIWNHGAQAGWATFSGYARGTMIIAFLDGMMAWIFLAIVGVPLAPALGVLVMIGALIPLVGAPAAMLVAMIVALATSGPWTALLVGIGIALIGQLEGHVLQPLIMGAQVSLSPVVVGIGVMAGTLLAGLLGAIIAIPVIGVTWSVFSALYHRDPPIKGPLPDLPDNTSGEGEASSDPADKQKPGLLNDLKKLLKIGHKKKKDSHHQAEHSA